MQGRKAFRRLRFSRFLDPGHSHQSSRISLRLRHYCCRNSEKAKAGNATITRGRYALGVVDQMP